jgi:hypothetical protein
MWILALILTPLLSSLRFGSSISQKLFPKGFIPWKFSRSRDNRPVNDFSIPISTSSAFLSSGRNSRSLRVLQVTIFSLCSSDFAWKLSPLLPGIAVISLWSPCELFCFLEEWFKIVDCDHNWCQWDEIWRRVIPIEIHLSIWLPDETAHRLFLETSSQTWACVFEWRHLLKFTRKGLATNYDSTSDCN